MQVNFLFLHHTHTSANQTRGSKKGKLDFARQKRRDFSSNENDPRCTLCSLIVPFSKAHKSWLGASS